MFKNNTGKKPFYKKWQLWAAAAVAVCVIGVGSTFGEDVSGTASIPPVSQSAAIEENQTPENMEAETEQPPPTEEEEAPALSPPPSAEPDVSAEPEPTEAQLLQEPAPESSAEAEPIEPSPGSEQSETPQGQTVYITKSGKRYHYNNHCNGGTYFEATLEEALDRGLTPCKKCVG